MRMSTTRAAGNAIILLLLLMLFAGCDAIDADITIDLYRREHWEVTGQVTVPISLYNLGLDEADMRDTLEEMIGEAEDYDAKASWEEHTEDESVIYTINMTGEGYDALSHLWFEEGDAVQAGEADGKRVVYVEYYPSYDSGFVSLTIRGDEVLSGNGKRTDDGTMVWKNQYNGVEAVFTEQKHLNPPPALGLVLGAGAIGVIAWVGIRGPWKRRGPEVVYCTGCGAPLPRGANFCVHCGTRR